MVPAVSFRCFGGFGGSDGFVPVFLVLVHAATYILSMKNMPLTHWDVPQCMCMKKQIKYDKPDICLY